MRVIASGMIILQLKSTQKEGDLRDISKVVNSIFRKYGYKIKGHEVQQLDSIINKSTLAERANMIIDFCSKNDIQHLTYHTTIFENGENIWDERWQKRISNSISMTIQEAEKVHDSVDLKNDIVIVCHLTSFALISDLPLTKKKKFEMKKKTEKVFLKLYRSLEKAHCIIALENLYPKYYEKYAIVSPLHPLEITGLKKYGVKTTLDISHYHIYSNYLLQGDGNTVGDLDREIYGHAPSWQECINMLADTLVQLHISDGNGYTSDGEGLPVGEGEIPISDILFRIAKLKQPIQGTIELKDGHLHNAELQRKSAEWLLENAHSIFI